MPKKTPKSHKFQTADRVEYEFKFRKPHKKHNADGLCYSPKRKKPKIYVDPKLLPRKKMAVMVEEVFHAFFFDKTEKEARKFAATITRFIYLMGWREKP